MLDSPFLGSTRSFMRKTALGFGKVFPRTMIPGQGTCPTTALELAANTEQGSVFTRHQRGHVWFEWSLRPPWDCVYGQYMVRKEECDGVVRDFLKRAERGDTKRVLPRTLLMQCPHRHKDFAPIKSDEELRQFLDRGAGEHTVVDVVGTKKMLQEAQTHPGDTGRAEGRVPQASLPRRLLVVTVWRIASCRTTQWL